MFRYWTTLIIEALFASLILMVLITTAYTCSSLPLTLDVEVLSFVFVFISFVFVVQKLLSVHQFINI